MGSRPGGGGRIGLTGGFAAVPSKVARCSRASSWLFSMGARGDAGEGCFRAVMMSLEAARMRSADDAVGITTWDGNHERVSALRSARVSVIQTR